MQTLFELKSSYINLRFWVTVLSAKNVSGDKIIFVKHYTNVSQVSYD